MPSLHYEKLKSVSLIVDSSISLKIINIGKKILQNFFRNVVFTKKKSIASRCKQTLLEQKIVFSCSIKKHTWSIGNDFCSLKITTKLLNVLVIARSI